MSDVEEPVTDPSSSSVVVARADSFSAVGDNVAAVLLSLSSLSLYYCEIVHHGFFCSLTIPLKPVDFR